jgi:hypothetical protein
MDLLPPVRDPRHLLPLRRRLDGRHPRVRCPRGEADRGDLRQAGHHQRAAEHPRRPRLLDDSKPVALLLADLGITQSRLPGRTARTSSPGTTTSTATAASACTPPPTSNGHAPAIQAARAQVLDAAYHAHPERFVAKPPTPPELPGTCWINPPPEKEAAPQ